MSLEKRQSDSDLSEIESLRGGNGKIIQLSLQSNNNTENEQKNYDFFEPVFEKEPIEFDLSAEIVSDEEIVEKIKDILERINKLASESLFKWSSVPIELPKLINNLNIQESNDEQEEETDNEDSDDEKEDDDASSEHSLLNEVSNLKLAKKDEESDCESQHSLIKAHLEKENEKDESDESSIIEVLKLDKKYELSDAESEHSLSKKSLDSVEKDENDEEKEEQKTEEKIIFVIPDFERELEELSREDGPLALPKKLNKAQLNSIKKTGEFEVASLKYADKVHRWRLSNWLQKGSERANQTLLKDFARTLRLLMFARRRLVSDKFSVKKGVCAWLSGIYDILDMLIGMPHRKFENLDSLLKSEMQKYFVKDLVVDQMHKEKFEELCERMKEDMKKTDEERQEMDSVKVKMPLLYRTPDFIQINLTPLVSILKYDLLNEVSKICQCKNEMRVKIIALKKELLEKYKRQGLNNKEISEKLEKVMRKECVKMISEEIVRSEAIERIAEESGRVLSEQVRSTEIMLETISEMKEKEQRHLEKYEKSLKARYSVRSLIPHWIEKQVAKEQERFQKENLFACHEMAIEKLQAEHLFQAEYFLEREMKFLSQVKKAVSLFIHSSSVPDGVKYPNKDLNFQNSRF